MLSFQPAMIVMMTSYMFLSCVSTSREAELAGVFLSFMGSIYNSLSMPMMALTIYWHIAPFWPSLSPHGVLETSLMFCNIVRFVGSLIWLVWSRYRWLRFCTIIMLVTSTWMNELLFGWYKKRVKWIGSCMIGYFCGYPH